MPLTDFKKSILEKYGTESEMARAMNWSRQKLNKITTGAKVPDLHECADMAEALGWSISAVANFFLQKKSPNG